MSGGDSLARGARKANFQVQGGAEFTHALKVDTAERVREVYNLTENEYREFLGMLERGEEIANPPKKAVAFIKADSPAGKELSAAEAPPFRATIKTVETPQYKAHALGDNVLVTRVEQEHSSQLIIPASAKAKSDIGRVTAVGPDVKRCKTGELILFDRFASHGKEIELVNDEGIARQNLLLNDVDVLLRLERSPKPN